MLQIVNQYVSQVNKKTKYHGVEVEEIYFAQSTSAFTPPIHQLAKNSMNVPMGWANE